MARLSANVWAGVVVLLYALVIFSEARTLVYYTKNGPGPGFFPLWVSALLAVFAVSYIWMHLKKGGARLSDVLPAGKALRNYLSVLGSIILFMLVLDTTGYVIACTAMMSIVLVGQYRWYTALGISVSTAVLLLVLFQYVMEIPLPANVFGF